MKPEKVHARCTCRTLHRHTVYLVHGTSVINTVALLSKGGQAREEQLNHVDQSALSEATKQLYENTEKEEHKYHVKHHGYVQT